LLENQKGISLIQRFPIVQTMGKLTQRAEVPDLSRSLRALVVADPAADGPEPGLPALPDAVEEGRSVAARFQTATLLRGKEATPAAIGAAARNAQVFHFAGHGIRNGGLGGLLLAGPQGYWTSQQISGLNFSSLELAVLSSCTSGITRDTPVVGNADVLVRSFLDAGAARVLASSWDVDSAATRIFMDRFYTAALRGEPPANALRQAILDVRSQPSTAHPSAWAAFQLYGRP
jgi:CHAT domain-containing protein